MTTVAYRDGVLAADSQATNADLRTGTAQKVFGLHDGSLAAGLGAACQALPLIEWLRNGKQGERPPTGDGAVIHVEADDKITVYDSGGWQELDRQPFRAWGSGAGLALGAMSAGASAEEAVAIAIRFDIYSGFPVSSAGLRA